MLNEWEVNVSTNSMPQKVATAMQKLEETTLGCQYEFIAYLGKQVANGINHAVLAKQVVVVDRDVENIVVLIFNEHPGQNVELALADVERVLMSGSNFGGITIDVNEDLGEEEKNAWEEAFNGFNGFERFVGTEVSPFASLGSQVVSGVNLFYVATITPIVAAANVKKDVVLVTINRMNKTVHFTNILPSKQEDSLKYAFTW